MFVRTRIATTLLMAAALPVVTAGAAHAGSDDVIRRGSCSGSTDWKIKAKPDDSRIEVEAEIDSNQNGQTWTWKLKHNGSVSARGTSTTAGPSGSFEVSRRTVDADGADRFRFVATNPDSDETCVAKVRI